MREPLRVEIFDVTLQQADAALAAIAERIATARAPAQMATPKRRERRDHNAHASSAQRPQKKVLSSL